MKSRIIIWIPLLLILINISSCTTQLDLKEMDKTIELSSAIALPLGQSTLTASDLFFGESGSLFRTDSVENYLYAFWTDTLDFSVDNNLTDFTKGLEMESSFQENGPAHFFPESGSLGINNLIASAINNLLEESDDYIIDYDYNFNQYENGEVVRRVDSLHINSLNIRLGVELNDFIGISPTGCRVHMEISFPTIPGIEKKRITLQHNSLSETIRLTNFTLPFTGNETKLPISLQFRLEVPDGKLLTVRSTSDIVTTLLFEEIEADKVWGYFNQSGNLIEDSFEIDIPDDLFKSIENQNNRLLFHDPAVMLNIESNIGIPLQLVVEHIVATDEQGNEVKADFNGSDDFTINLPKPEEGSTPVSRVTFNRENGGTNNFFSIIPQKISSLFHVNVNHYTANEDPYHFLSLPARFNIPIECKLPFQFDPGTSYRYTDSIHDANISNLISDIAGSSGDIDIKELEIVLHIENSLPVKALAKVIFLDEELQTIQTEDNIEIPAPEVDPKGRSIGVASHNTLISAGNNIKDTKQIVLTIHISGDNKTTDMIYFRFDDKIKSTVGLYLKGLLKTDLDSL